jgi:hypothetical protein
MLSTSHSRAYQDFITLLKKFRNIYTNNDLNINTFLVQKELRNLQEYFEQQIIPLDSEKLDSAIASRWQSVQTEIKREFKLLTTDVLFLNSARQPATRARRLKSICDRTIKLINYCQIMLS